MKNHLQLILDTMKMTLKIGEHVWILQLVKMSEFYNTLTHVL